jgi:hypothetical protein
MMPASLDCPYFFIAPTVFYEMATCNLKMFLVDRTQNSASYNDHLSSPQFVLVVSVLLIALTFYIVLLCVIRFLVPCCDVRYDSHIKTMFGSPFTPVVCRRAHFLFTLFVFVCVYWCPKHIVLRLCLFVCVLCTLCCNFSGLSIFGCPCGFH